MINEKSWGENREVERIVPHVLIFDVDGVLTHPSEKKVTELGLFTQFMEKLEKNEPIILNTGRATDFMIKQIIEPLEQLAKNKKILKNLFAVGEKGAVVVEYDANGDRSTHIDQSISVPEALQIEARQIVEEKFSNVAFYDTTKKTMISIEMLDGLNVNEFRKRQGDLNEAMMEMLIRHGLEKNYKVDPSRIATDVENNHVGKGLGVQRALKWLAEQKISANQFITFGDSPSDTAMAEELHQRGLPVEFVFVGEKSLLLDKKMDFPVTYTDGHCESGTMEYLKNLE